MCHWKKSRTKSKNTWRQRKMIMQKFKINGIQQKQVKREFYTSLPNETKINVSQPGKGHIEPSVQFSSVQSLSHVWSFVTPWTTARQASLSITNSRSLLKLMSIASVMPSNHLILWHPLLLLPSIFPSIRVFSNELVLHIRWPKYWSFSFSISPSNEYSGLISFRIDWLDLFAIQGTLKSLLQYIKPTAFTISSKIRDKTKYPTLTTFIQHGIGSPSHTNLVRRRNKRNPDEKEKVKLSLFREVMIL